MNVLVLSVVGVDGQLSSTGKKLLSSTFQSNKFLTQNNWTGGVSRLVDVSLLPNDALDASVSSLNIQKIVFVGLAQKEKKETENSKVLNIASQYAQEVTQNEADVTLNSLLRDQCEKVVGLIKKELKEEKKDEEKKEEETTATSPFTVYLEDFDGHIQSAAEGIVLGNWKFDLDFDKFCQRVFDKAQGFIQNNIKLVPGVSQEVEQSFKKGIVFGASQLLSRYLLELPANFLTPTLYCEAIQKVVDKYLLYVDNEFVKSKLQVTVRDEDWAREKGMGSFLSVARGSDEKPKILELVYTNNSNKKADEFDLAIVGKGITFDSGGISLKPGPGMKDMKGDMGGSSCAICSLLGAVQLQLPVNVIVVAMMTENMPSGHATKPGDVVKAMNGKTIEVDNTDAEGRLILADGLCYVCEKSPETVLDIATLTGAVIIALGHVTAGVYTSNAKLWRQLEGASFQTNDYFWRMPIFREQYLGQMKSDVSNLNNIGGREGGSCTAATFLSEFIDFGKVKEWAHLDIAAVAQTKQGYTGRPTRAVLQFIAQKSQQ
ncbi:hypothetical protein ABK040_015669 [Willaertia magna]